jgi:hypothetical protein
MEAIILGPLTELAGSNLDGGMVRLTGTLAEHEMLRYA